MDSLPFAAAVAIVLSSCSGAFGNAALAAVMPILIGIAFDAALASPPNLNTIGMAALGIIASQTLRAILQLGRNFWTSSVIGERLERDTRHELYVSLLGRYDLS